MAHVSLSHRSVICRLHQRITLTVTEHMQMSTRRRKAGRGRKDGEKTDEKKKKGLSSFCMENFPPSPCT